MVQFNIPISCFLDSVDEDKMLATGISRFCDEAGLDPTSSTVLILAWKFKAATQCEFTRAEFVGGMTELGYVIIIYVAMIIFTDIVLSVKYFGNYNTMSDVISLKDDFHGLVV